MKYQTKILLYFSVVALLFGIIIGCLLYRNNVSQSRANREKLLQSDANRLIGQMDDQLERMDAIINYILSDPGIVDDMKTLGMVSEGTIPSSYELTARTNIRVSINTDYILKNSYRSVFYNLEGDVISSFVQGGNTNLTGAFEIEKNPYLAGADEAGGKNVLTGVHSDLYVEGNREVFSLLMAVQGKNMGYLEVENTTDSLAKLTISENEAMFLIMIPDGSILYSDTGENEETRSELSELSADMEDSELLYTKDYLVTKAESKHYGVAVITAVPLSILREDAMPYRQTAILGALIVILGSFLIIFYISSVVVRPVKKLTEMIDETTLDTLADSGTVSMNAVGIDEMQMLADSFGAMKERLDLAIRSEKRASVLQLRAQFDTLQAQVNPHFLYNVLNIISARGVMADDETICEMCGALAAMLRYSTSNKERYASVRMEVLYLQHYTFLMKERYGDRLKVDINIDDEILDYTIPKMTLQQLVENSVKHGFANVTGPMNIRITGCRCSDRWTITVEDNGDGFSDDKLREIKESLGEIRKHLLEEKSNVEMEIGGMGIANTYARCLLFFGEDLIFEIGNGSDGANVEFGKYITIQEKQKFARMKGPGTAPVKAGAVKLADTG